MPQMITRDVREILPLLKAVELAAAGFYQACAGKFEDDAGFWGRLAREERQHAAYIHRGGEVIARDPARFHAGREFNTRAIGEFIEGINKARTSVEEGSMDERQALRAAYELEDSYIEKRFSDTVYGEDPELLSLLRQTVQDTIAHRKLLREKLDSL